MALFIYKRQLYNLDTVQALEGKIEPDPLWVEDFFNSGGPTTDLLKQWGLEGCVLYHDGYRVHLQNRQHRGRYSDRSEFDVGDLATACRLGPLLKDVDENSEVVVDTARRDNSCTIEVAGDDQFNEAYYKLSQDAADMVASLVSKRADLLRQKLDKYYDDETDYRSSLAAAFDEDRLHYVHARDLGDLDLSEEDKILAWGESEDAKSDEAFKDIVLILEGDETYAGVCDQVMSRVCITEIHLAPTEAFLKAAGAKNWDPETRANEMNRHLLNGADINAANELGQTALYMAVADGEFRLVHRLLRWGADPNVLPTDHSDFPLNMAAYQGNWHIFSLLVRRGAEIDRGNGFGETPLLNAMCTDSKDIRNYLIEELPPSQLNAKDGNGFTALARTLLDGRYDVAEALVLAGADPVSALAKCHDILEPETVVLEYGVRPCLLRFAFRLTQLTDEQLAADTRNDVIYTLWNSSRQDDALELIERLSPAQASCAFHTGTPPLARAVADAEIDLVRALLDAGAAIEPVEAELERTGRTLNIEADQEIRAMITTERLRRAAEEAKPCCTQAEPRYALGL